MRLSTKHKAELKKRTPRGNDKWNYKNNTEMLCELMIGSFTFSMVCCKRNDLRVSFFVRKL